jgi:hypothetical protein
MVTVKVKRKVKVIPLGVLYPVEKKMWIGW